MKSFSARKINLIRQSKRYAVWQRGFYDRIIRNDKELAAIRNYIRDNPLNWLKDSEFRN